MIGVMMDGGDSFDLRDLPASFYDDPYPTFRRLRDATPVLRMPDGALFLTRHADLVAVYRDPRLFSSDKRVEFAPKYGPTPLYEHHTTSLVFNDPPLHTRVRKLIAGALTSRAVADMESGLIRLVDGLLDAAETRGKFDLVEDFAAAIPIEVIGNLLGVPGDERGPLRDWSLAILGALEPALSPDQLARGDRAVVEFCAYLRDLVADRRKNPGDPARGRVDATDPGRGRRAAERDRAAAKLHFHPQRGSRDHHQPDRQRAGGTARTGQRRRERCARTQN